MLMYVFAAHSGDLMRLPPEHSSSILQAAQAWAKKNAYQSAEEIPVGRIGEFAAAMNIDPVAARQALLELAELGAEGAKSASAQLGPSPKYDAKRDHAPIGKQSALGAFFEQQAQRRAAPKPVAPKADLVESLAELDKTFRQTARDFERTRIAITEKASPKVLDELHQTGMKLLRLFQELGGEHGRDRQAKEEIVRIYKDFVSKAARDRGVFLTKTQEAGDPSLKLAGHDGAGQLAGNAGRAGHYDALGDKVAQGRSDKLQPKAANKLGDIANVAVDAQSGERFVFDFHGKVQDVVSIEQYVTERQKFLETHDLLAKRLTKSGDVQKLRSLSDEALQKLSGTVARVSIVEDDQRQLARVYPTKWHKPSGSVFARRMVVEGPFKGIYVDDLVSKLAEGKAGFKFDPKAGHTLPSSPKQGEPFITTASVMERGEQRDKLYIRIPFEREWTETRQALRSLADKSPYGKYITDTKNTSFYFEPTIEVYDQVMTTLRCGVLSETAAAKLDAHAEHLWKVEAATSGDALRRHSAKAIGGFKAELSEGGRKVPFELHESQRRALATLEANGYSGLVPMDIGKGKTAVGLAAMLELRKREKESRPVLVVVPKGQDGNFVAQAHKFCANEVTSKLDEHMVVLNYDEFKRASRTGLLNGKRFSAKNYGALIVDEAHNLFPHTTRLSRSVQEFGHDRKILLSARPTGRRADSILSLIYIANNVNLNDRKIGKDARAEIRRVERFFCENVGGRTVGLKSEVELSPGVAINIRGPFDALIKENVPYVARNKREDGLPPLETNLDTLTMPEKFEEEYRKIQKRIDKLVRGAVSLFRDKGVEREYVDEKGRHKKQIHPLARNRKVAHLFGTGVSPDARKVAEAVKELGRLAANPALFGRAAQLVKDKLASSPTSRTVCWHDSPAAVLANAWTMSSKVPVKLHAACLRDEIHFFQGGKTDAEGKPKSLDSITVNGVTYALPFKKQAYRRDPDAPPDPVTNRQYQASEWVQFVLDEIIKPNKEVATGTFLGPAFMEGHNLQWADTVLHLDLDTFSRSNMVQRVGRVYRQGQERKVDEHLLLWSFKSPKDNLDRTMDQMRLYFDQRSEEVFQQLIVEPQSHELGKGYSPARDKQAMKVDFELLGPWLSGSAVELGKWGG